MAPPASQVKRLMGQLLGWLRQTDLHPLIASCVFHYEFEFIHPFSDGNGRMGRLWQTLILSQWQPLLAQLPVESLVFAHQSDYYQAINASTKATDSASFIEFMLQVIKEALQVGASEAPLDSPHVTPHVTPHVKALLEQLALSNTPLLREQLQEGLGLRDRKSFRERYLKPALDARLIEMTKPDKPKSRSQQYRLTLSGRKFLE